jgi:peptidoglycan hydrolase CwlO-like protein
MKKNKIRKIVLVSIVAVLVITGLYRLSIEPSDYNQAISKQINKANVLLENAKLGNDKGDYSKNTVLKMKNSIAEAEALIEEEAPDIDDLRSQYKKIKEDIKEFKASSNKNCLSKEDVEKLKKDNESFTKENALGSDSKCKFAHSLSLTFAE